MEILTTNEEKKLTNIGLLNYYEELRDYLIRTPHESLTKGSLTTCEKINPMVRVILNKFSGYEIIVEGNESLKGLQGIYAYTHQSKMDHVNFIATNPNHTILLNSVILSNFYKLILSLNGVVYVDKSNKESKQRAKLELMRLLLLGKSITIFPESAWNCSPNKLHLPLYIGFIDMAKKTGSPIIPVVQEYIYDEKKQDGIERIKSVHVRYGKPIYVMETDDSFQKMEEYSTVISTMRWELIEENGIVQREEVSNFQYMNYLKGIIRNLKNAGIDIEVEKQGIFGANDAFYLFHYLNAVNYNSKGEFEEPEHVKKLTKLYNENCIR